MNILIDNDSFNNSKVNTNIPLKCEHCEKTFYILKKHINYWNKINPNNCFIFCSKKCEALHNKTSLVKTCSNCNNEVIIKKSEYLKSKSGNCFCSKSCSAVYNNLHKKTGTRRSKLEFYIEEFLSNEYPDLKILYNDKSAINSELDLYIPSLKIAFELNGIYHYEPIHGNEKFNQIKNNDSNKFQLCQKKSISLCIIDTSSQKHFKKENSKIFTQIITDIINSELLLFNSQQG